MQTTLIIVPLQEEFDALCTALTAYGLKATSDLAGTIKLSRYQDAGIVCALGGHGKTQFGIQTQYLLHKLNGVEQVLCVGAAGGLCHSISAFDIVIAEKTVEHDYQLKFAQRPLPEFFGDVTLLNKFKSAAMGSCKIHFGIVASGDEDVVETARASELHARTNALAVAWEGAGGARAAKFNDVPYLEIRAITDSADKSAPVDFEANLKTALKNVADLIVKSWVS